MECLSSGGRKVSLYNSYSLNHRRVLKSFTHLVATCGKNFVGCPVTPKSVPPKNDWSCRTDFGRKICQNRSPRTTFAAKIGPAGPILAAKNGPLLPKSVPHGGPILAKNYLPKSVPPQSGTLIPARTWLHGCSYYI